MTPADLEAQRALLIDIIDELRVHIDITMPGDQYRELLERVEAALAAQAPVVRQEPGAIGSITTGDVEFCSDGTAEISDWDIDWYHKVIDAMPEFAQPETTYEVCLMPVTAPSPQADAEDAARYRWLRDGRESAVERIHAMLLYLPEGAELDAAILDAAIDAARKEKP